MAILTFRDSTTREVPDPIAKKVQAIHSGTYDKEDTTDEQLAFAARVARVEIMPNKDGIKRKDLCHCVHCGAVREHGSCGCEECRRRAKGG